MPPLRTLTARHPIIVGACVAAALALAACSSDPAASDPANTTAPSGSTQASDATAGGDDLAGLAGAGVQRRTFTAADGTAVTYVIMVPDGRTPGEAGKVLLAFPPGGQDIDLTEEIVRDKWAPEGAARGYVVVSPAAPSTGLFFNDASAALVPELLDFVAATYPPEGGRFDLAGVSNGGLSAFKAALAHPERFRSLVVFPGYSPDGADDPNLVSLRNIGVAMYVGAEDGGWLDASRTTRDVLTSLGGTVELHEVPGQGHILGDALPGGELYDAIARVRG